jgi:hypothetical protein
MTITPGRALEIAENHQQLELSIVNLSNMARGAVEMFETFDKEMRGVAELPAYQGPQMLKHLEQCINLVSFSVNHVNGMATELREKYLNA